MSYTNKKTVLVMRKGKPFAINAQIAIWRKKKAKIKQAEEDAQIELKVKNLFGGS